MKKEPKYYIIERMLSTPRSYCTKPSLKKRSSEIKFKYNYRFNPLQYTNGTRTNIM